MGPLSTENSIVLFSKNILLKSDLSMAIEEEIKEKKRNLKIIDAQTEREVLNLLVSAPFSCLIIKLDIENLENFSQKMLNYQGHLCFGALIEYDDDWEKAQSLRFEDLSFDYYFRAPFSKSYIQYFVENLYKRWDLLSEEDRILKQKKQEQQEQEEQAEKRLEDGGEEKTDKKVN